MVVLSIKEESLTLPSAENRGLCDCQRFTSLWALSGYRAGVRDRSSVGNWPVEVSGGVQPHSFCSLVYSENIFELNKVTTTLGWRVGERRGRAPWQQAAQPVLESSSQVKARPP